MICTNELQQQTFLTYHTDLITQFRKNTPAIAHLPKSPFENFITKKGDVFETFDDFLVEQFSSQPSWKKPGLTLIDDFRRVVEKYYEEKHCLPVKYLRGLKYHKPSNLSSRRFVKIIVKDYERQITEVAVAKATAHSIQHHLTSTTNPWPSSREALLKEIDAMNSLIRELKSLYQVMSEPLG